MAKSKLNGAVAAYAKRHPATALDLAKLKSSAASLTFNDRVEGYYYRLIKDQRFRALIDAVEPSGSVEGSLKADDFAAARMVREAARTANDDIVAEAKQEKKMINGVETPVGAWGDAKVAHSLKVALSRHDMNREKRYWVALDNYNRDLHARGGGTATSQ